MSDTKQYRASIIVLTVGDEVVDVITGRSIGLMTKLKKHLHWEPIMEELVEKKLDIPKSLEELEKLIYTSELTNKITLYKDRKITVYK